MKGADLLHDFTIAAVLSRRCAGQGVYLSSKFGMISTFHPIQGPRHLCVRGGAVAAQRRAAWLSKIGSPSPELETRALSADVSLMPWAKELRRV